MRTIFFVLWALAICGFSIGDENSWGYRYTGPEYFNTITSLSSMSNGETLFVAGDTLARIGKAGNILWQRKTNEPFSKAAEGKDGRILAVTASDDSTVTLFDAQGNLQWQKKYSLPGNQFVLEVLSFPGAFVLGFHEFDPVDPARRNLVLYKINASGNLLWARRFPGFNPSSMSNTPDGGMIVLGRPNVALLKLSNNGSVQWAKKLGRGSETPAEVVAFASGYLIVTSHLIRDTGEVRNGIALRALSREGKFLWQMGYKARREMNPFAVELTPDRIVIGGQRQSADSFDWDAFLMETDLFGNFQRVATYGNPHHQTTTNLEWSNGTLQAVVRDSPASVPGPKERNWVVKFPDDKLRPTSCNRILASNPPLLAYELPAPDLRTFPAQFENIIPEVLTASDTVAPGALLRTSLCSGD